MWLGGLGDSHNCLSSLAYKAVAIRVRFLRAASVTGAASIADFAASWIYLGIGFGPCACEGHVGEKWSFATAQHGHMNQCEDLACWVCFCSVPLVGVLPTGFGDAWMMGLVFK